MERAVRSPSPGARNCEKYEAKPLHSEFHGKSSYISMRHISHKMRCEYFRFYVVFDSKETHDLETN